MRPFLILFAAASAATALPGFAAPLPAADGLACGGAGSDERREMAADTSVNFALEMSVTRGAYISDVDVHVIPESGGAPIAGYGGPICQATLAPGRYRVEATYNGITRTAEALIPRSGRRAHVAIAFPASERDRYTEIPTPEEKQQARTP